MREANVRDSFAHSVNQYLNFYVGVADAKATIVVGASASLLLFLASHGPTDLWSGGLFGLALGPALIAGALALLAIVPRSPSTGHSLIFWGDIITAYATHESYVQAVKHANAAELEDQWSEQNYYVGRVLAWKLRLVRWSLVFIAISLVTTSGYVVL